MMAAAGVEKLRLKFPGAKELLFKDVSLTLEQGQKILLLGPSGCGKSTLLQVLSGLIPRSVEIPLKYERINIPESWGYVFQDPDTQFCMPFVDEEMAFVLENMRIPRERMNGVMTALLHKVGLRFDDPHIPISTLSQGMKQRLAIASVMALEPEVLFLDEPTALLDPQGTKQVWSTIKEIGRDKTVVIVEHKIDEIIDFVDRVIIFNDQAEMIADGEAAAVFRDNKALLDDFGIWYPGVWDDYVQNGKYAPFPAPSAETYGLGGRGGPLIRLNGFTGFRGKEARIAADRCQAAAGEWIAVVGENGAGKSTLLQALMQLIPTGGEYVLGGRPVRRFEDVSGMLGYVFQNPEFQFVTNSVYEEIAYTLRVGRGSDPPDAASLDRQVGEQLGLFGLEGHEKQHPFQLSLGQKRRLSVAAAIVRGQQAVLLDEPTFGQDAKNTFAVLEKLEGLRRQGTAVIMVTHDMDIVRHFSTRVWHVERGRLVADTDPAAFLQSNEGSLKQGVAVHL